VPRDRRPPIPPENAPGQQGCGDRLPSGAADRADTVGVMARIARPVLEALSENQLRERMPVHDWEKARAAWTHSEAFARTLAGVAPWLALGADGTEEGELRRRFIGLSRRALINATDPEGPDSLNFGQVPDQPLVEASYLAYALLRARDQLWEPLDEAQRRRVLDALKMSRRLKPYDNNWLLFPAMVEAALWELEGELQEGPIETAIETFQGWYVGDGVYGDGPAFQWDYYNSYVIHPMMLMVLRVAARHGHPIGRYLPVTELRARRYAAILERMISPEGTFPVIGRSSAYRFAAFFHLADSALNKDLPPDLDPGAVRAGITAVVRRTMQAPNTFDAEGWLRLGAVGHQPGMKEFYTATGSLYACLTGLVHLGLPGDDPFWTAPPADWTQRAIWSGDEGVARDRSLEKRLREKDRRRR
jgi:hypothetical protein